MIGLTAGAAMAVMAAGRRSSSTFERYMAYTDPPSINVTFCPIGVVPTDDAALRHCFAYDHREERAIVARIPGVDAVTVERFLGVSAAAPDDRRHPHAAMAIVTGSQAIEAVDGRHRIVAGRRVDPDRAEVVVNEAFSRDTGLGLGDRVTLTFWSPDELGRTIDPHEPFHGPSVTVPIVGISRGFMDLTTGKETYPGSLNGIIGSPRLAEATAGAGGFTSLLIASHEPDGAIVKALQRTFPDRPFNASPAISEDERRPLHDLLSYEASAIIALGLLVSLAVTVVSAQAVARQSRSEWADASLLRAIGCTRGQIAGAATLRGLALGLPAASVAAVTAGACRRSARSAWPDAPIPHEAWSSIARVLLAGFTLVIVISVGVAALTALRTGRVSARVVGPRWGRLSTVLPPAAAAGLSMTRSTRFDQRSGPLGSAFVTVAIAMAGLAAAFGLVASVDGLSTQPARYGAPWDVSFGGPTDAAPEAVLDFLRRHPDVDAVSGITGTDGASGNHPLWIQAFQSVPGVDTMVDPPIISGRAPTSDDEVALGEITMRAPGAVRRRSDRAAHGRVRHGEHQGHHRRDCVDQRHLRGQPRTRGPRDGWLDAPTRSGDRP